MAEEQQNPTEKTTTQSEPEALPPGGFAGWKSALAVVVGMLALDHLSKWLAIVYLKPEPGQYVNLPKVDLIPGLFQLQYAENTGAAFSMFDGNVGALAIVSILAASAMTWWWTRLPAGEKWGRLALSLVVAGAIGNLIDRVFRGYVVDFFLAYFRDYRWPVFNVADTIICIGVGVLILRSWQGKV